MDLETIERLAQEKLAQRTENQERATKYPEQMNQAADLEDRNSKLMREIILFRDSFLEDEEAAHPLRVVLKRDKDSKRSIVGIIDTVIDMQAPGRLKSSRFRVVSTESDKELQEYRMSEIVVAEEATLGQAVFEGWQGYITRNYPFSGSRSAQRQFTQGVKWRLDSVDETFEVFKQAAMDPDLNPHLASKIESQPQESQAA